MAENGGRVTGALAVWRGDFGFLLEDGADHSDVFIHRREWPTGVPIQAGQRLSFRVTDHGRGPRAEAVEALDDRG